MLLLLFLCSMVFFVSPIDSKSIDNEITKLDEYLKNEINNFTEVCLSIQRQQSQKTDKMCHENENITWKYFNKRKALIYESVASQERKNICNTSTLEQFSWVLFRFPKEFEINCSSSISRLYNNEFNSNDYFYTQHIYWLGNEIKNSYKVMYQNCEELEEINPSQCLLRTREKIEILKEFLHEKINQLLNPKLFDLEEFDEKFPLCFEEMKNQLEVNYQKIEEKYLNCLARD